MKKYKQVMSVVRGQWSVAKGYKREDRRQMAGGKNIKTILPSWLLASRVGPVSVPAKWA